VPSVYELQLTLEPPQVLGRRLRPLTLGHAHLLEIAGSPFILGGQIDATAVILAAWLLTYRRHSKARRAALAALAGRPPWWVRRWGRRLAGKMDLQAEATALGTYISACTKPPRTAKSKDAKALATPTAATIAVLHRHYFHTPAAAVWDIPFLDAMIDVVTYHHARGWLDLIGDKQAAFIDRIAARKKAAAANRKAAP